MEFQQEQTQLKPVEQEIKELVGQLRNVHNEKDEEIRVLKEENELLRATLETARDDLLEMVTRVPSGE